MTATEFGPVVNHIHSIISLDGDLKKSGIGVQPYVGFYRCDARSLALFFLFERYGMADVAGKKVKVEMFEPYGRLVDSRVIRLNSGYQCELFEMEMGYPEDLTSIHISLAVEKESDEADDFNFISSNIE